MPGFPLDTLNFLCKILLDFTASCLEDTGVQCLTLNSGQCRPVTAGDSAAVQVIGGCQIKELVDFL